MDHETNYAAEEVQEMLNEKRYRELKAIFASMEPADIAIIFEDMSDKLIPLLYRILPKDMAADVFVEMDNDQQELLIAGFSDQELKEVLDELYVDDAVDIIEEMPASVVKRMLKQSDPEMRRHINEILKYPDDSAGSLMTIEYISLKADMTVSESFVRIRRIGEDKETINILYVTDKDRHLIGVLSIRNLVLADPDDLIRDIMETNITSVTTLTDKEEVAQQLSRYDYLAMPVVDQENRLVGIVTIDDALDVLQEENTEDIEMLAGITPTDKPYIKTGIIETYKKRIPWLLILMISAAFTGAIITHYENALGAYVVLTAFIPMLMSTGGNAGSQASVSIIRGLALDEIDYSDTIRILLKELTVGTICGITLAVANFAKLMLFDRLTFAVSIVICGALLMTVVAAKLIGCSLPILAKRLGFDPAVMANPFITTLVDAISLIVYFQIATMVLHI
ncbi:MAG: magnesium transporter [Lachnospiraceae bacterium]|nr:magnesium transporter [Lachnospiraceae bacterium]